MGSSWAENRVGFLVRVRETRHYFCYWIAGMESIGSQPSLRFKVTMSCSASIFSSSTPSTLQRLVLVLTVDNCLSLFIVCDNE